MSAARTADYAGGARLRERDSLVCTLCVQHRLRWRPVGQMPGRSFFSGEVRPMPARDDPLQKELRRLAEETEWSEHPAYVESRWGLHPCHYGTDEEGAWVRLWWPLGSDTDWYPELRSGEAGVLIGWRYYPDELQHDQE